MIYNAPVRSFVRLSLYVAWIFVMIPVQSLALLLRSKWAERIPVIVHRVVVKLIDARLVIKGEQCRAGPVLFVSNHASYADISILGSLIRGAFVAKAEVASWPLFGSVLNDPKAVETVMARLNALRGPIAHCSPLADDEILRLSLTVKDWFRMMKL